jgi:transposase
MKQEHSWEITDAFWTVADPLPPRKDRDARRKYQRKPGGGRPPMHPRKVLEAIFFVLRTGIQWNAIPASLGSSSAVHRYFRFWCDEGFFQALWQAGLAAYEEAQGVQWSWLSAGGCMTKAPLAREAAWRNPADRGKKWQQTPYARRYRGSTAVAGSNRGEPARCIPT